MNRHDRLGDLIERRRRLEACEEVLELIATPSTDEPIELDQAATLAVV
jgi:hypothetical protein